MSVFGDLVALAKAGYTPAQVKEILALQAPDAQTAEKPAEIEPKESPQPEQEKAEPEKKAEAGEDTQATIADLQQKLAAAEEKVKALQQQNSTKDNSTQKPVGDPIADIVRGFM